MSKKVVYTVGRYTPPQRGHINYFKWLLSIYDRLIIGIGSCYTVGENRHPLLAFMREKMILNSLIAEGVDQSRVSFFHLPDFDEFEGWFENIISIPSIRDVTAFATGNEEDILKEFRKKGIDLMFKLINPEKDMPTHLNFPFHASDLRNAIANGNYSLFNKIAAPGTIALMSHSGGFNGIREAMENKAIGFVSGRQTVDMIVILRRKNEEPYVLCGIRSNPNKRFYQHIGLPGDAIADYENPMDAAIRALLIKTGIDVKILARHLEPSHVMINNKIFDMKFLGLFSAVDKSLAGDKGGSSQAFCIELDDIKMMTIQDSVELTQVQFRPIKKVLKQKMAYQQKEMLEKALKG